MLSSDFLVMCEILSYLFVFLLIERTAGTISNLFLISAVLGGVCCPRVISAGYARGNHTFGHPVSRIRLNRDKSDVLKTELG